MQKRPHKLYILFACALTSALVSFIIFRLSYFSTTELAQQAELKLHAKEVLAKKFLDQVTLNLKTTSPESLFLKDNLQLDKLYETEGIAIYVYKNDSLRFWSDNQPTVDLYAYTNEHDVQLIKIRNGWYEYIKQKNNLFYKYQAVALISIKPEYDFENRYLHNSFSDWLGLPENTTLITPPSYTPHTISSVFGMPLFEISRTEGLHQDSQLNTYACLFAAVAFILFFVFLFVFLRSQIKIPAFLLLTYVLLCLLIRTLMMQFKFPSMFYNSNLYDAGIFANASSLYFSFMGDIIINCFFIFIIAVFVYKTRDDIYRKTKLIKLAIFTSGLIIIAIFSFMIRDLIFSLVNNTTISYNINELFAFSGYSIIGFVSIALLVFSFYLLIEKAIVLLIKNELMANTCVILFLVIAGIVYGFAKYNHLSPFDYLWPVPLVVMAYLLRRYKASYNFINTGSIILVSALIVSHFFGKYEQLNNQQSYDALSLNLSDRQDVIAENEFIKISNSIKEDQKLKSLLLSLPENSEQIEQKIRQVYFNGYFERYDMIVSMFRNDSTPVFDLTNPTYLRENYFKDQIKHDGYQTISDELYFVDKDQKPIRYLAEIDIEDLNKNPNNTFRLYLQLEPKLSANLGTFPEILLDKSIQSKLQAKQLSYAVYDYKKLQASYGDYQYPRFINNYRFKPNDDDEYQHFQYLVKGHVTIIITDKKFGFWQKFTSNSYLFVFFSVIILGFAFFNSVIIRRKNKFSTLNNRIQFMFVSVVILSLVGVVIGTVWVVSSQFELKNQKELISKSQSVLRELQQTVGQQNTLDPVYKDYTTTTLKRLALLFGSDISLFGKRGMLFSSSQPAIYEQGLISKFMDPTAYSAFKKELRANYSHKESIGSLNYLSAYLPFYNKNDKLMGYINLPYFSRQKDLEKELTAYLTTLINIYTILFAITTLVALLVSNFLTKPLRMIKQQISNIKFGAYNESLKWKSHDEIGNLVEEYNTMLVKLEKNTELLAKSERENAWREMAKQVAHEIKNPLTPMKLNIQHLQRVVQTHPDDINERVTKVSKILIEQIDVLSHIATEFSNFAKLPTANLEIVYVNEVLQNLMDLFQQNTDCEITLVSRNPVFIRADKEQCLRIFTNLLKNAEQSIPEDRKGKITITVGRNIDGSVIITVEDNGSGIEEHQRERLFTPNFTTKTTGTGLGLAMVKNSVVSFGGTIDFETEVNKGTTFTLVFPKLT